MTICGLDGKTLGKYKIDGDNVADLCAKLSKDSRCTLKTFLSPKTLHPFTLQTLGSGFSVGLGLLYRSM